MPGNRKAEAFLFRCTVEKAWSPPDPACTGKMHRMASKPGGAGSLSAKTCCRRNLYFASLHGCRRRLCSVEWVRDEFRSCRVQRKGNCRFSSVVERLHRKQRVVSSILTIGSSFAGLAQMVEQMLCKHTVTGSNPVSGSIKFWGCSSVGRAPALQAGCRRFDPVHLHHCGLSSVGRASAFQAQGREFEPRSPLQFKSRAYLKLLFLIDAKSCYAYNCDKMPIRNLKGAA